MSDPAQQVRARQVMVTARERAELLEVSADDTPLGPREVRGRTVATLISPGTELNGNFLGERFPMRPGYAAVFEVLEAGPEVRTLRPGDLAFCQGKHRSWQRETEALAQRVPDGLEPGVAAFARMMSVSMTTLHTTRARPPARVLVTGLGLVGHLAARIFQSCGYEVTAVDPNPARRALAGRGGLRDVREAVPPEEEAGALGIALALECSGHEAAALAACRAVRERGEVVLIGSPWARRTDLSAHELIHAVFHRYVTLRSGWEWEIPLVEGEFTNMVSGARAGASVTGHLAAALRWLDEGRVDPRGLFQTLGADRAQEAYSRLLSDPAGPLTFVLDWTGIG